MVLEGVLRISGELTGVPCVDVSNDYRVFGQETLVSLLYASKGAPSLRFWRCGIFCLCVWSMLVGMFPVSLMSP